MVFVTTSGGSLCISPYKDGLKPRELVRHGMNAHSVLITFPENDNITDDQSILDQQGLIELFQVIANDMPHLRSITISGSNYSQSNGGRPKIGTRRNVPPLRAVTSLLSSNSSSLLSLCLVQIRLLGSDREMMAFINAIRLHQTLHSFDCTGCVFEKRRHVSALEESCKCKSLGHCYLASEYVVEEATEEERRSRGSGAMTSTSEDGWWSLLSYPLHLCFCI